MKLRLFIVAVLMLSSCKQANTASAKTVEIAKQEINTHTDSNDFELEVYDYKGFEKFLNKKDGKVHVINFWATWCVPCVKELPYFEKLNSQYKKSGVEVILVSLDMPHLYDSKLKPFIKKKQLKSKVIALDDADMNTWIPKVNKEWSGAIPATVIYKDDKNKFFEGSLTFEALETEIKHFLN